jgi:hypothetical protein
MPTISKPTTRMPTMRLAATRGEVLLLAGALLLMACGGDDDAIPPVIALYDDPASSELSPWPSNRYTVPADTATGLQIALPSASPDLLFSAGLEETVTELSAMDGFSTTGGVVLRFSGPLHVVGLAPLPADDPNASVPLRDATTFTTSDSPLILLDVDPSSPDYRQAIGLTPRWWEQAKDDYFTNDEFTLIAEPATPLRPATRYLFVVTDALKGRDGASVARSERSEALLAGQIEGDYAAEVGAALGELGSALGVGVDRVKLASVFTTASITEGVTHLSQMARASAAPVLSEPWTLETPEAPDGRIRFRAVYDAPEYRTPSPDARWQLDADGNPIVQSTAGLEVFMAMSDAATSEPRTVVIYGHGLGGDKDGCWGTAERLADLNVAVLSIDSPHHGSRGSGAGSGGLDINAVTGFFGLDLDTETFVIGRARDNFRQMASDQLELVKLVESLSTLDLLPAGAPDGVPDLDTSRILYIGHSFGAVQGATIFALAPEISHGVWNVGGAGLMKLLRDSPLFSTVVVNGLKPDGVSDGAVARFMAITQVIVDPGDPLNYARFAAQEPLSGVPGWSARDVLIQQVIDDGIVPNSSTEALARAAGLALVDAIRPISGLAQASAPVSANLPSGATGAITQFDTINGDQIANHGELIFSPEGRDQYLEFFRSGLAGPHATVVAHP